MEQLPPPVVEQPTVPAVEDRLLRLEDVAHMVSLGKSTIYTLARAGKFPKPIKRTARRSVWLLSEVQAFIRGEFIPPVSDKAPILKLVRNSRGGKA
jgi:prophage regulatory protein